MRDDNNLDQRFLAIPSDYREIYGAIDNEVAMLHAVWNSYKLLFAGRREDFDRFNEVAPAFASMVQMAFQDTIFLRLTRLTDPASQGKVKDNLTMQRLKEVAAMTLEPSIEQHFSQLVRDLSELTADLRTHRNKRIAHADLDTLLGKRALPPLPMQTIEDALRILRDAMNELNHFYRNGPTIYENPLVNGDSDSLIYCVKDGLRLRSIRHSSHELSDAELRVRILERVK